MQIFPAGRPTSTSTSGWRGGKKWSHWTGVSNVTREPQLLPLHVQLQFYYLSYFVICCNKSQRNSPRLVYEISATLPGTNTACFNSLSNAPIIASSPTCFISRLLNPRVWPQISFDQSNTTWVVDQSERAQWSIYITK